MENNTQKKTIHVLRPTTYRLRSFGLIEVLISGVILITVISATLTIRQRASSQAEFARHEAVAYMLAQEGIEAVRHIRDTNYLIPLYQASATNDFTSIKDNKWNCDITKLVSMTKNDRYPDSNSTGFWEHKLTDCTDTPLSVNTGNFEVNWPRISMELGRGTHYSTVTDVSIDPKRRPYVPLWHLSSPTSFDGGTWNGAISYAALLPADQAQGVERVYMKEGTIPDSEYTQNVLSNDAPVGDRDVRNFSNYWRGRPPTGYKQYRRQVIASEVKMTDESAGNLPALWSSEVNGSTVTHATQNHLIRVMIRVSWDESDRFLGTNSNNAVLLTTYLTDWRPSN